MKKLANINQILINVINTKAMNVHSLSNLIGNFFLMLSKSTRPRVLYGAWAETFQPSTTKVD